MRDPVAVKHRGLKFFIIVVGILLVAVARLAKEKGIDLRFYRVTALDHTFATDDVIDDFLAFYRTVPGNAWVHLHCAGGTCAYFEYYPGVKEWRVPLFVETGYMIHVMKMYADQNVGNGYSKSWSQWKKETFGK